VVLEQNEPAQLWPKVTANLGRHRRHHRPAVRSQPAFAADANNMPMQHEILDEEVLVALEAGAWRNLRLEDALLLADGEPFTLAALGAAFLALAGWLGLGALSMPLGFTLGRPFRPLRAATSPRSSAIAYFNAAFSVSSRSTKASSLPRDRPERVIFSGTDIPNISGLCQPRTTPSARP
jgi:hypothetical protein